MAKGKSSPWICDAGGLSRSKIQNMILALIFCSDPCRSKAILVKKWNTPNCALAGNLRAVATTVE